MNKLITALLALLASTSIFAESPNINITPIPTTPPPEKVAMYISTPNTFMTGEDVAMWEGLADAFYKVGVRADANNIKIILNVTGVGGSVYYLNKVVNGILFARSRGVEVDMRIVGPAMSAHALLACSADKVVLTPTGSLMFHFPGRNVSVLGLMTYFDKSRSIRDLESTVMENALFAQCVKSKLLTTEQLKDVLEGKELVISRVDDTSNKVITILARDSFSSNLPELFNTLGVNALYILLGLFFFRGVLQLTIQTIKKEWRK